VFRQYTRTLVRIDWLGLCAFMRTFIVKAEGFGFKYFRWESCEDMCYIVVYCLSDLILEGFLGGVCITGLEVVFSHEGLYFRVIMLY
jgi:hypothetical protein